MNATSARVNLVLISALLPVLAGVAAAADQPTVRAPLQSVKDRKPAPNFVLRDSSGKTVQLKDYLGKVVLLDFWATWCTGCKKEIPWFSEFQGKYGAKGFAVVGVSLDEGGWKVVKPFLADAKVPYRMLLGNDPTVQRYGIKNLPDTFLIDRQGRVAAAYRGDWWTKTMSRPISRLFSPITSSVFSSADSALPGTWHAKSTTRKRATYQYTPCVTPDS